jgi:hypothetical protein
MKLNTFIAAIAVAAASAAAVPVAAQSLSAGEIQLAKSVGVAPGTLSLSQLIMLDQAQEEGGAAGRAKADAILKSGANERFSSSNTPSITAREIFLDRAIQDGDDFLIRQYSKEVVDNTASDRGTVSQGKAQLAASLNVNAADFTTAELVALQTRRTFESDSK